MKNSMYEQAIFDAQNLRKMAEESAKNKLIEAVMPQIREIIEKDVISPVVAPSPINESSCNEMDDEVEEKKDMGSDDEELLLDESDDDSINESDAMALAALIGASSGRSIKGLNERINVVRRKLARMLVISESVDHKRLDREHAFVFVKKLNALIKEALQIKNEAILIKESGDHRVYDKSEKTLQEIKEMARRMNRGVFSRLFEADELNELDATLVLEPSEDEADEVEELLGDLDIDIELGGSEGEEGEDEEEEGEDMEADEEGEDEEIELDLGEADMDEGMHEGMHEMEEGMHEEDDMDEVYEIDESTLRRALRSLREGDAAGEADHFGGGSVRGDVIVDIDEDDLLHALNDVLGDAPMPTVESRRRTRRPMAARRATTSRRSRVNEGRNNRALRSRLTEAHKANGELKRHLQEMNLFNAKLLYANKLMQNKSLSTRQQRAIVEALDSAKTLREAKLLFQSLSNGVKKSEKTLSESVGRVRGSSSQSTPRASAQPLQEGAGQTDRWAILAGIPDKK